MSRALAITALAIGTALIVVLASATLFQDRNSYEESEGWTYGDVRNIGATAASGSLQLQDGYLIAASTGSGSYTDPEGTHAVTVKKAQLDILIIAGQSNATYRTATADPSAATPAVGAGVAWYYGTEDAPADFFVNASQCAMWPMADSDGTQRIGDKWPSLASAYHAKTGHKVYVFELAKGGESVTSFDPDTGWIWQRMKPMTASAMAAIDADLFDVHTKSYIWIQGEADADMPIEEYKQRFMKMHNSIINNGLGIHIEMCQIVKTRESRAAQQAEAELQLAADHPGTIRICSEVADTFTLANGLLADQSHYTQAGNNLVGSTAGASIGEWTMSDYQEEQKIWRMVDIVPIVIFAAILIMAVSIIAAKN